MKTRKQKKNERLARMCDEIAGGKGKSQIAAKVRSDDRRVEKRKRRQFNQG